MAPSVSLWYNMTTTSLTFMCLHHDKFLIIKPTRCTNFSKVFILEWNSTCFGQFLCPLSGVFNCTHSNGICHTGLLTACEQNKNVWEISASSWFYYKKLTETCSNIGKNVNWTFPILCFYLDDYMFRSVSYNKTTVGIVRSRTKAMEFSLGRPII
jgi:hypothetical protein